MPAPGVVLAVAVVLIVAAMVFYLVSTILVLRRISAGLNEAIAAVVELIEKTAPVAEVVGTINAQFDTIVSALPGIAAKAKIVAERRPR